MSSTFRKSLKVTASTKRNQIVSGQRAAPTLFIPSFKMTPLTPLSKETARQVDLQTPYNMRECFCENIDIRDGDILVLDGKEHPIKFVMEWDWKNTTFKHLVVEIIKRQ